MTTCQARRGFLTLSNCENPAITACSGCGRSMCSMHLTPQSGFTMCFDCAVANPNVQQGEYDDLWAHRYRDSYRSSTPMYRSHYYDSQDRRSFDQHARDAREEQNDRSGFGDS